MKTDVSSIDCELSPAMSPALARQIDEMERWWHATSNDPATPWDELAGRLHDLRELLSQEFQTEFERETAIDDDCNAQKPRARLEKLSRKHAGLLADLDQLVMRLRVCTPGVDCWADSENALLKFLAKLRNPR